MVELTDPLETIVSILKNSSTGIGTTGYEITDDDASGLTITDGEILVSYTMSKDELKAAFGGTQDYDVIITVKRGEVEDTWIGLSTKVWKVPIIITINVIDKWSAVATKYITAPLVLYKTINALRKFIKAKTSSPGGSINVWEALTWKEEKDIGTKPIIHRCICTSEALLYYNPNPAGVADTLTVTLNSERDDEADTNLGTITENSTVHDLPGSVTKEYGARVQVTYTAGSGDEFSSWAVSGLVVVEDSTANPTYMRVNGAGTLQAIYALACPSGEQVTNGGFEDNLNDWDHDVNAWLYGSGNSGDESCELDNGDGYIEQTLATETPVDCIATFECYVDPAGNASYPNNLRLTITYTDDSTSTYDFDTLVYTGPWQHLDLKSYLTAGKTIKKIKFAEVSNNAHIAIDDVTIVC